MANIFQKMALLKQKRQLINVINNSRINIDSDTDPDHLAMQTSYIINQNGLVVIATQQWHHAQGSNYLLTVKKHDALSNIPNIHALTEATMSQKEAKKIFIHMHNRYLKQIQK